ncbi:hypothetical protein QU487_06410 [Crenobacter sp. SG2305]|uniref:hypothetical protein n=1 Tax=Crenobacter oryzisoli TaxID=3056844 RepID=UPI0025AB5B62|nr:hypothetical protein [Crenobacter sp. SG2305]MDN0082385.1 hypothetical protein [Crenobacter sp. SG2305]
MEFSAWCKARYGQDAPKSWLDFLAKNKSGVYNGDSGAIWGVEYIMEFNEDRNLFDKGVCVIGCEDDIRVYLLRIRDGRVFAVDPADYQVVDAWFADIQTMADLCQFEQN